MVRAKSFVIAMLGNAIAVVTTARPPIAMLRLPVARAMLLPDGARLR